MSNCSSVRGRSSYSQTIFAGNFEINSVIDTGKREERDDYSLSKSYNKRDCLFETNRL